MTTCVIGADAAEYEGRVAELNAWAGEEAGTPNPETWIMGTVEQAAQRLREYEAAAINSFRWSPDALRRR